MKIEKPIFSWFVTYTFRKNMHAIFCILLYAYKGKGIQRLTKCITVAKMVWKNSHLRFRKTRK